LNPGLTRFLYYTIKISISPQKSFKEVNLSKREAMHYIER